MFKRVAIASICVLISAAQADEWVQEKDGVVVVKPAPIPEKFQNPTTPEYEAMLQKHATAAIQAYKGKGYGNTYFENEKNSYPVSMLDFLAGNREKALKMLQGDDTEGYNRWTLMVDFYPAFTLKGQVRKYFWFGPMLDPAYKKKMFDAAKIWTAADPATKPHPIQPREEGKSAGKDGWMPNATGICVDGRMTDNLRAMRDVGIYLFAEETGNKATQKIYRDKIAKFAGDMYQVGHGEWDSNNYLYHTFTAYTALYDYAKDDQVRGMAKGVLDFISASAAVKYWRGDFGGPSKRDYGGKGVNGSNAAIGFSYYFGDSPVERHADRDDVHVLTSGYRPPPAIVALAQKKFDKPVEIFATKPVYEVWRMTEKDGPSYYETTYIANTYQLGTLTRGSGGDINGFKLMTFNGTRGTDNLIAIASNTTDARGISTGSKGGENVAQAGNAAIFLAPAKSPVMLFLPKSTKITKDGAWLFVQFEKTWAAFHAINLDWNTDAREAQKSPEDQVLLTSGNGDGLCGFAMELGEGESFDAFVARVKSKASASIEGPVATLKTTDGRTVQLGYQQDPVAGAKLTIDGKTVDFAQRLALWQSGEKGPINMPWRAGPLTVQAGGKTFTSNLVKQGDNWVYTFENK